MSGVCSTLAKDDRRPRPTSPIPPNASNWNEGHSDQLNIFYVPLEKSKYLNPRSEISGFKDGCALVDYDCEYDYKRLLRDVVKPKDDKWWDAFNEDYATVLDKIDENFKVPDVNEEFSLALSKYFSRKRRSSAADQKHKETSTSSCIVDDLANLNLGQELPDMPEEDGSAGNTASAESSHASYETGQPEPVLSSSECHHADVKTILNSLSKEIEDEEMGLRMKHMKDVSKSKRTPNNTDRMRDILLFKDIANFLQCLRKVVVKYAQDEPTDETCFEYIFQSFTRIYFLDFSRAPKRVMGIFGEKVSSVPDLRFETLRGTGNLVITVAEVKKTARESDIKTSFHELRSGQQTCSRNLDVIALPTSLRGQHAAELLLELPYSVLSSKDVDGNDDEVILGMIVQCTWVRLTCLKMKKHHLKLLKEDKSQPLGDLRAEIHYSKAYDILNRKDRRHLAYILLLFAYLNDELFFEMYL